jgi:hypothetical protein
MSDATNGRHLAPFWPRPSVSMKELIMFRTTPTLELGGG